MKVIQLSDRQLSRKPTKFEVDVDQFSESIRYTINSFSKDLPDHVIARVLATFVGRAIALNTQTDNKKLLESCISDIMQFSQNIEDSTIC